MNCMVCGKPVTFNDVTYLGGLAHEACRDDDEYAEASRSETISVEYEQGYGFVRVIQEIDDDGAHSVHSLTLNLDSWNKLSRTVVIDGQAFMPDDGKGAFFTALGDVVGAPYAPMNADGTIDLENVGEIQVTYEEA